MKLVKFDKEGNVLKCDKPHYLINHFKLINTIKDVGYNSNCMFYCYDSLEEAVERIDKAVSSLSRIEEELVRLRFGLDGKKTKSIEEAANIIGITYHEAQGLEKTAIHKLKNPFRAKFFMDLLTPEYNFREENRNVESGDFYGIIYSDNSKIKCVNLFANKEYFLYINDKKELSRVITSYTNMMKKEININKKISELGLSIRTEHSLIRANINTVKELVKLSENDVRNIHNLGENGFNEVKAKIDELGLSLLEGKGQSKKVYGDKGKQVINPNFYLKNNHEEER